jgi:hypothetical protein
MKKSILSIVLVALCACLLVFQACKKPKCPEEKPDPCLHPVTVTALSNATYNPGHFKAENSGIYLFAINFDQYAAKVTPGRSYKIGYEEVPCEEVITCGDQGIAKGGCVQYPKQCIRILCLEEIKCGSSQCMSTVVNPLDYDKPYSQAVTSTGISGNSLDATISFSGCSASDPVKFALYAQHTGQQENGLDVWEAKAVNMGNEMTCMAVFTKTTCFDISAIKKYYMGPRQLPPAEVLVKFQTSDGVQEFVYKF